MRVALYRWMFSRGLPRPETSINCPSDLGRMLDSEGSAESVRGSENSTAREETIVTLPNRQNADGDKLEEFEKLLQTILPSRTPSQEEEETEENEIEKKIGSSLFATVSATCADFGTRRNLFSGQATS